MYLWYLSGLSGSHQGTQLARWWKITFEKRWKAIWQKCFLGLEHLSALSIIRFHTDGSKVMAVYLFQISSLLSSFSSHHCCVQQSRRFKHVQPILMHSLTLRRASLFLVPTSASDASKSCLDFNRSQLNETSHSVSCLLPSHQGKCFLLCCGQTSCGLWAVALTWDCGYDCGTKVSSEGSPSLLNTSSQGCAKSTLVCNSKDTSRVHMVFETYILNKMSVFLLMTWHPALLFKSDCQHLDTIRIYRSLHKASLS